MLHIISCCKYFIQFCLPANWIPGINNFFFSPVLQTAIMLACWVTRCLKERRRKCSNAEKGSGLSRIAPATTTLRIVNRHVNPNAKTEAHAFCQINVHVRKGLLEIDANLQSQKNAKIFLHQCQTLSFN